jgi:hypothetical protein
MYEPRLTTEGFIEGAMMMMNAMLKYLHKRTWTVLVSERPGESFVVSDHPVLLEWSDPRGSRFARIRCTRTRSTNRVQSWQLTLPMTNSG